MKSKNWVPVQLIVITPAYISRSGANFRCVCVCVRACVYVCLSTIVFLTII